jgi:siroheme synthase
MGAGLAETVAAALMAAGAAPDLPVLVVESATLPEARRIALTLLDLPEITRHGMTGPTLIMLGRVFAPAVAARKAGATPIRRSA